MNDVRSVIYSFCDGVSLAQLQMTCRDYNREINRFKWLWKLAFKTDFGCSMPPEINRKKWKSYYVSQYLTIKNIKSYLDAKPSVLSGFNGGIYNSHICRNKMYVLNSKFYLFDLITGEKEILKLGLNFTSISSSSINENLFVLIGKSAKQNNREIILWDALNNRKIFHQKNIDHGTYYLDEQRIICSFRGKLKIWDLKSDKIIKCMQGRDKNLNVKCLSTKLKGNLFLVLYDDGILIAYDTLSGKELYILDIPNAENIGRNTNHLIILIEEDIIGIAEIREFSTGKLINRIEFRNSEDINDDVKFTPNQMIAIQRNDPNKLVCWNLINSLEPKSLDLSLPIETFDVLDETAIIFTTTLNTIHITFWNLNLLSTNRISLEFFTNRFVHYIRNGILYLSFDYRVYFFSIKSNEKIGQIDIEVDIISDMQSSSPWWLFGRSDEKVRVYNLSQMPQQNIFHRTYKALAPFFSWKKT